MKDGEPAPVEYAFESVSELRHAHEQLLDEFDRQLETDGTAASDIAAGSHLEPRIREFITRGAATGVFLAEVSDRTAAQVLLDYWVSSLVRAGIGAPPGRLVAFDATRAPDLRDKPCPYVGLDAFRVPTFFFGRESDTQALLAQIDRSPLVVVVGTSGSGKSSLVMGGVLPALAGREGASAFRVAPPIVPGNAVLVPLAVAALQVSGGNPGEALAEAKRLADEPRHLATMLGGADAPATVIPIDQFEEVFTLVAAPEREALAASLAALLEHPQHRVILTMREEFRSRLVELRDLAGFLETAWYSMRPMGYEALRAAVERPAAAVNLQFQPGIVDDVVKKVLGQQAALPLLQFTLRALWDRRDRNRVTREVYAQVGDPLTALQTSADAFYRSRPPETQHEIKRILLALVRVDELLEAYRQPLPKHQLLAAGQANTNDVISLLEQNDYLRVTEDVHAKDAIVEVKHESLIRNWPLLVSWIDEKRIQRRQRIALTQAAERWQQAGRPAEGLLTGWQLEEAKRHSDLTDHEREFVAASTLQVDRAVREREAALNREKELAQAQARREQRIRRWVVIAAGAFLLVVSTFTWIATRQSQTLGRLQRLYFAAAASDDPLTQALLLAELGDSNEVLERFVQLFADVAATPIPSAVLDAHRPEVSVLGVQFGDARRVATVDSGGTLRWWSADGRGQPSDSQLLGGGLSDRPADGDVDHRVVLTGFSGDGKWIATVTSDGSLSVAGTDSVERRRSVVEIGQLGEAPTNPSSALAIGSGGQLLALARDGDIGIWRRTGQGTFGLERTLTAPRNSQFVPPPVNALCFDDAGERLAAAFTNGVIRVWTIGSDSSPMVLPEVRIPNLQTPFASSVQFNADGSLIVAGYNDNVARVWSATDAQLSPYVIEGHTGPLTAVAFQPSPDKRLVSVATGSSDQTTRLSTLHIEDADTQALPSLRLKASGAPMIFRGHKADVRALAFSADGRQLATASADGTTRIWPTTPSEPRLLGNHTDEIISVSFNASGDQVLTASYDGKAQVFAVDGSKPPTVLPVTNVRAAAFNPSPGQGTQIALGLNSGQLERRDLSSGPARSTVVAPSTPASTRALKVAFNRDGTRVAAAFTGHIANVWENTGDHPRPGWPWTLTHPKRGDGSENRVYDVALDPRNPDRAVTAADDGKVRLWIRGTSAEPTKPCSEIQAHVHHETTQGGDTRALRALFAPEGGIVVATAGVVTVWQPTETAAPCPTGWHREPWEIRHATRINDLAADEEGTRLLTGSDDGAIRLTDSRDGNRLLTLRNGSKVSAVALDRQGRYVATGDANGAVRLWHVSPSTLAAQLRTISTACLNADERKRFLSETEEQARTRYANCESRYGRSPVP